MKNTLLLLAFFATFALAANPRVIGYFPNWASYSSFMPSDVRYNFLSDIRYGYVIPSGTELAFADQGDIGNFEELVKLSKQNKVRIVVSIGGLGNEQAIADASAQDLANAAKEFAAKYGVDGFELDPGAIDASSASKVVEQAEAMLSAGLNVAIALPGEASFASSIPAETAQKLDAVSLWFTDQMSANEGSVKANCNINDVIKILSSFNSVPKEKLFPIIPFYGKTFEGAKSLGASYTGIGSGNDGVLQYKDIMERFNSAEAYKVSFDEQTKSEIAVNDREIIVFNGIPSMQALATAIKQNGYGGVAAFDITGDHKEPIISLLVTVGQVLRPEINYKKRK